MNFNLSGGPAALRIHVRETAEAAEAAGCTMFTCMDHYFQMEAFTRAEDPMLEGNTTLGYVAARTETMTLGLLVTGVSYRHSGLLAARSREREASFGLRLTRNARPAVPDVST